METRRMPLQDLPLEQFLTGPGVIAETKMLRHHKRPLSPSRTTPLNPAKRRVLDAEGIPLSNNASPSHPVPSVLSMHTATPTRPSRLGNGLARNYGSSQGTLLPLSSHPCSPPREPRPKPTLESSTGPQLRHYPGFDIFPDAQFRRGSAPRTPPPSGDARFDRSEEEKENMPLKRKAKKLNSKKRLLSGLDGSDASCLGTPLRMRNTVHPFPVRHALR